MIDGFISLAPLLVLPIVLLLAVWGCTLLFPFEQESPPIRLPLTVEARFQLPEDANIDNLIVVVQTSGVTLDGDALNEVHENRNPALQDDGMLLYISEFPSMPEGSYTVVCDVYELEGRPIIERPEVDCDVVLTRELGGDTTIHFDAEAGESVFTCDGV